MSLADYVAKFEDGGYIIAGGKKVEFKMADGDYRAAMACHNATFIWLYRATHDGEFPPLKSLEAGVTQDFVNNLIKLGHPTRVTSRSGPLAGDVLIFADPDTSTVARHSCVVVGGGKVIAGYNQTGWFDGGLVDDFSQHSTTDIDWVARCCGLTARRADAAGAQRYIWAVREATALAAAR